MVLAASPKPWLAECPVSPSSWHGEHLVHGVSPWCLADVQAPVPLPLRAVTSSPCCGCRLHGQPLNLRSPGHSPPACGRSRRSAEWSSDRCIFRNLFYVTSLQVLHRVCTGPLPGVGTSEWERTRGRSLRNQGRIVSVRNMLGIRRGGLFLS